MHVFDHQTPARRFFQWDAASSPYVMVLPPLLSVDVIWCIVGHWTIPSSAIVSVLLASLGFLSPLAVSRYRHHAGIRAALTSCASFVLFSAAGAVLSYLVVSTDAPLIDARLVRLDQWLGFDWPGDFHWLHQYPRLMVILWLAYGSVIPQIGVVTLHLAFTQRRQRLREFNHVLTTCALLCIVISGFIPAAGPFKFYGNLVHADTSMLSHFEPLRAGILRTIDLRTAQGLISMPSFHMVMAALIVYAMRGTRLFLLMLAVNLVVMVATPFCGGHYLVDLMGGLLILAVTIALRRSILKSLRPWPGDFYALNEGITPARLKSRS